MWWGWGGGIGVQGRMLRGKGVGRARNGDHFDQDCNRRRYPG